MTSSAPAAIDSACGVVVSTSVNVLTRPISGPGVRRWSRVLNATTTIGMPEPSTATTRSSCHTWPATATPASPAARSSSPATRVPGSRSRRTSRLTTSPPTTAPAPCTLLMGPTKVGGLPNASATA